MGVALVSPEDHKINCIVWFKFKATNNATKYEALRLRLTNEMQVKSQLIISNSELVVSQVNGNFTASDKGIAVYFKLAMDFLTSF